ncbi:MAG: ferrous iron transporter B [Candidatus Omnitrophica bacterium]|nr:ferrous iron transporter B [Candidatus Omnitrophota bacterium]MBU4590343.1 ferrous iron transporter B [Candidatus Omnitrophota bacterium]
MKKILLMGNPNVGKSAIFSRLTGARIIVSNYPGTTVEFTQGQMKIGEERPLVIDVPGTYTLEPTSKAEEVAVRMLKEGDLVINIVNATNLERNLYLTLELLEKDVPLVIALNMWDETKHQGINIDIEKLEKELGVPVIPTCGLTGEGIKELITRFKEVKNLKTKPSSDSDKWERIGEIVERVQKLTHHHHTFLQRLEELSIKPLSGLPIAAGVIYVSFWAIRLIGEGLITYILEPLFDKAWTPLMLKFGALLGEETFLHDVLIGKLIDGSIDFKMSFGVLTTGIFVPIAMVLPYIISFYLILGILEDFGYLPRLAVLVDNFMHHIGLHGFAIVPMMLGLGCNVPGALALRLLEGRREKFIAATLMAISIPCMAQIAMIVGLVGQRGGQYLGIIFGTLFILLIVKGLIMNKVIKGASPEMLIEIPPYRLPQFRAVIKKLFMRVSGFLKEAVPYVLLGVFFVNILYALNIIQYFSGLFAPVLTGLWGLPKEAISALIIGFLRKDVAIGMLGPLNLTTKQLIIGCTVLAIYFPCIATFVMLVKELGIKDMLKAAVIMMFVALIVGTLLNIIL